MIYKVYVIINKINYKMYIGSTKRELKIRLQKHFIKANNGSLCSLHKAIRKYGKDNFDIRMIEIYPTREAMLMGEIEFINYFNTYKSEWGYNDTPGGEGGNTNAGKKFSEKWKLNISKRNSGKIKLSTRRFSKEIEQEICRLYIDQKISTTKLAKQFNCYSSLIIDVLNRNNIIRRVFGKNIENGRKRQKFSLEIEKQICNLYQLGNISRTSLALKFGCGKTTIRKILIKNNILT